MKKLILKLLGEPRKRRAVWVALLITSLAVLSIVGLTEARYVLQWTSDPISYDSDAFYFTSDHLVETNPPTYNIANFVPDSSGINFQLYNYDQLQMSECDISYTVQLKNTSTNALISTSSGTITISERSEAVNLTVPATSFDTNNIATVTVTASATSPYSKTLSATYKLYQVLTDYTREVNDSIGSNDLTLTIDTQSQGGTIRFITPVDITPTLNSGLTAGDNNSYFFNASSSASYTFTFTKTTPANVYTENNFTFY